MTALRVVEGVSSPAAPMSVTREYRDRVARRRRRVDVLRHIADNEDNASFGDVDLAELYVGTRLRSRAGQRRLAERALRDRLAEVGPVAPERAEIESELANLARPDWRGDAWEAEVPIERLLAAGCHTVVLGEPGCGKSTLLDALAVAAASGEAAILAALELADATAITGLLPVAGSLAEFAGADETSLHAFLRAGAGVDAAVLVDEHLAAGTALVLLDGLDEVTSVRRRTVVVGAVVTLLEAFPRCRCMIAARPAGYMRISGTEELELAPLREDQVERCLRSLLQAHARAAGLPGGEVERRVGQLLELLERDRQSAELAHNPLMVAIIAACNAASVVLPHDRVRLYHRMLDTLLRTWELARHIGDDAADEAIQPEELWAVWGAVALRMQQRPGTGPMLRPALERLVGDELVGAGHTQARARALAGAYLDAASRRAGILTRRGDEFTFWHPTFGEYLAGFAVAHGAAPRELLFRLRRDVRQVEVVTFALGIQARILGQADAADAGLRALAFTEPGPWEGLLSTNLRFAVTCVSRGCPVSADTWDLLLRTIAARAQALPYEPHLEAFVALAATAGRRQVGAGAVEVLGALTVEGVPLRVRRAAVELLQRVAERDRRAADLCADVLTAAPVDVALRASACLGLLRAGVVDPAVCRGIVGAPLVGERTRGEPFALTAFGVEVGEVAAGQVGALRRVLARENESNWQAAAVLAVAGIRGVDVIEALFTASTEVAGLLGWLAADDPSILARLLACALAAADGASDLEVYTMAPGAEQFPWRGLRGACARPGWARSHLVGRIADALVDEAQASRAGGVASVLLRGAAGMSQELRAAVVERLRGSPAPGRHALRVLKLDGHGRFGAAWQDEATRALFRACLLDASLGVRADALADVIDHDLWDQLPEDLIEAFVDASVACLAAEADTELAARAPKWGMMSPLDGARGVCLAAVRRLARGLEAGTPAVRAAIQARLRVAVAAEVDARVEWAAILLAEADDPDHAADRGLVAAARGSDIFRQGRAALQCFRRRDTIDAEVRDALPELLWRGMLHSRGDLALLAALRVLGPPNEVTLRRIAATRSNFNVDAGRMAWLHTNERATEILAALAVGDDEPVGTGARALLQATAPADERVTAALVRAIESVPVEQAVILAHALQRRIHGEKTKERLDPRVVRAWDRCLDAQGAGALWLPIDELVWEGGANARILAAIRRALADPNLVAWRRVAWTCALYSAHELKKPVEPSALQAALRERIGIEARELFAGIEACCASKALRARLDAAILCLGVGGPRELVDRLLTPLLAGPVQEEMRAFEMWGPALVTVLRWVLPEELGHELCDAWNEVRYDVIAAAVMQARHGAPLPVHVREVCLRRLAEEDDEGRMGAMPSWPLALLLAEYRDSARAGVAALRRLLRNPRSSTLRRPLAQDPRVADLLVDLACAPEPGERSFDIGALLHEARDPGPARDAIVGALERRFARTAGGEVLVARVLCALGQGSTMVQDAWIAALACGSPAFMDERASWPREIAGVWPRLREVWPAGDEQAGRHLLGMVAALDRTLPLPGLEALVDPLLTAERLDVVVLVASACVARGLSVAPARLQAAILRGVVEARPRDLMWVRSMIAAGDEEVRRRLYARLEPILALDLAHNIDLLALIPDHPSTQGWRRQVAWTRLLDASGRFDRLECVGELRRLGATEEELLTALLPRFFAGESDVDIDLLVEVLQERSLWQRRSVGASPDRWSDPRDEVARPIADGLFLARYTGRIPDACVERLVDSLGATRAEVDGWMAQVAASEGASGTRILELVHVRGGDTYERVQARAWLFGRLPHAKLELQGAVDKPAWRLFERLRVLGSAGCRVLADRLDPRLKTDLPGSIASDSEVAQRLVELVQHHKLEAEVWRWFDDA